MKLHDKPRIELLYACDNIIIPCRKGQIAVLSDFIESIGEVDLEKDYTVTVEIKRQKRSLDANAYYHVLARKCALKKGITLAEYHNRNLAELGISWDDENGRKHWILQKDDDWWLHQLEIHFAPTDKTEDRNGVTYRWFYLLKPSRFFDTKEMSVLIDAVVQDAKALNIETMTPNEIERIKQLWGKENARKEPAGAANTTATKQ